ncbi:RsmD family RNA methyltransferase [Sinomicrobium weinanense]|uniref:RsmD family RNA methyltransferase n=1 Tax=Sinomicrobium weinanense TaxID=2842200 RepID=A0A926Q3A4_9FLAO|nr:RsmD family RNA methyltransferase [Sinomicrobium weinanense]MBC9796704.1 RsmD family RNA methyltransferase [Sinomicrobium weinanense]MBU3123021.1 RsmD family RNA methyltransferase [Sinomicrobium weinanense]
MRIISGKYKGKRLMAPKKLPVRPTTDFAKEALFNILENHFYLQEISVLDLFAGTGNISYEFASRGCTNITSVDAHPACVQYIHKTAKELDLPVRVIKSDVFRFLDKVRTKTDLIFADPPYDLSPADFARIAELVFKKELLGEEGFLIIEHSKFTSLEDLPHFSFHKRYGNCVFSFFEWEAEDK